MLELTFAAPTVTAEAGRRTITGIAAPWNVVGTVADGRRVVLLPGSLDASARPLLLRAHDPARPLGTVTDATDNGDAMTVVARVSATADGNDALVLAADGAMPMLSVGIDPTSYRTRPDGVLEVAAADWRELSLLTFGAFPGAVVTDVAASAPGAPGAATAPDPEEEPDEEPDEDPDEGEARMSEPTAPVALPIAAAAPLRAVEPVRDLRWAANLISAGGPAPQIQAALSDLTTPGAGSGVVVPHYVQTIAGLITYNRPTINAIESAALPPDGMQIIEPNFVDPLPAVGLQATEKTPIASGPFGTNVNTANVLTWAGGADVSLAAAERTNPSFLEAWLRAAAESYARQTNGYVCTALLAAATVVAPAATPTFLGSIAALIASFDPAHVPAGQIFVGMSWDIAAVMIGVPATSGPAFWSGSVSLGGGLPIDNTGLGLNMYVDRQLPAKTMLAGVAGGAVWYEDPAAPAEIRVADVGLLGINVAVYGFAALLNRYPGAAASKAFSKMTFTTPPAGLDAETASASKK